MSDRAGESGAVSAVPAAVPDTTVAAAAPDTAAPGVPGEAEVRAICALLEEHRAAAVAALDLRELHSWTDFFIIATVSSGAHLRGLVRHIKDFAAETGLAIHRGQAGGGADEGWNLVDMGTAVIHLMNARTREFYELEELWSSAGRIFPPERAPPD
ncbi:MAG: ribosome silencing factor [Treponema sp.]|nr:ribosome silencing factor [Treponema sp.]